MLKSVRKICTMLRRDEKGATLVEYGIALFVAIVVGGSILTGLADTTNDNFYSADQAANCTGSANCVDAPSP